MRVSTVLPLLALFASIATPATVLAQGGAAPASAAASLTPLDYIEIRQLVARYAYAVDTGADEGRVYASLFAADGAFADRTGRETTGREALAALARRNTRGPQSAFHFIVNHIIEPSPEGARGKEFLLQLRIGDGDRPNDVFGGGHYDDIYVKTGEGWRFKRRQFMPSEGSARPPTRASAGDTPRRPERPDPRYGSQVLNVSHDVSPARRAGRQTRPLARRSQPSAHARRSEAEPREMEQR